MKKKIKFKKSSPKISLITCAFCRGTGLDRFDVPSKLSQCSTCKGRGKVDVPEPHRQCPSCLGTGVYSHHRLNCAVCGGKGRVGGLKGVPDQECGKEHKVALDVDTGLPCISAYDLVSMPKGRKK